MKASIIIKNKNASGINKEVKFIINNKVEISIQRKLDANKALSKSYRFNASKQIIKITIIKKFINTWLLLSFAYLTMSKIPFEFCKRVRLYVIGPPGKSQNKLHTQLLQ